MRARENKYKKTQWVRKLFLERKQKGLFNLLIKDLHMFDHEYFFKSFRMSPTVFERLLSWVAPYITKSSVKRDVVSPAERLSVTLRFLCTGDAQITIATSYRISPSVVGRIIRQTCSVIWNVLLEKGYLRAPRTSKEWKDIASEFENKWDFPHCVGAIDGKHVMMQAPPRSGSDYFNYKKFFSIVLLGISNAKYEFILVDIGDAGRQSDGGVYANSQLGYAIDNNLLNIPAPEPINGYDHEKIFPYVYVADDAFSLKTFMIKPYASNNQCDRSRVICNYRISRARRVIENAFGIVATRFRIFRRPIIAKVETVVLITKAAIGLHNFLMKTQAIDSNYAYCPNAYADQSRRGGRPGQWRNDVVGLTQLTSQGSNNFSYDAKQVRDNFKSYFNSEQGSLPWQDEITRSTTNPFDEQF